MDYLQEWFRLEAENKAEKNKMQEAIDKQMEGLSKIFPYLTKQQTETILSTIEQIVDKCCVSSYQMGYNDALMAFAMGHVGIDGLTQPEA